MRNFKNFFLLSFVLASFPLVSADVIYLKNGRQIECKSAWEEGKEVKYVVANGKMGIPKSMVAKIVKTDVAPDVAIPDVLKQPAEKISPQELQALEKRTELDNASKERLARLYSSMAITMVQQNDLPGALEYFLKAYRVIHTYDTTFHLAATYFLLKDDWNSELYFHEALKLRSEDPETLNYLGEIAWRNEKLADAQSYWQKSLELRPDPDIKDKLNKLIKERKVSDMYENSNSMHFLIKYDGGTADGNLVREISDYLEESYQTLASQFETYPNSPFVVILYPRQQFFKVNELPFWAGGANDGKIKLPIKGLNALTDELREVLIHELAHSFLRVKTSDNCPGWLQEGLAQFSEGKRAGEEGEKVLSRLSTSEQLPQISKLESGFTGADTVLASVLYLESLSFTQYLVDRYRFYEMNAFLDELGTGATLERAFEKTYRMSLNDGEKEWRNQLPATLD